MRCAIRLNLVTSLTRCLLRYDFLHADLHFEKFVNAYVYNPFYYWSVERVVNKTSKEHISIHCIMSV